MIETTYQELDWHTLPVYLPAFHDTAKQTPTTVIAYAFHQNTCYYLTIHGTVFRHDSLVVIRERVG